MAMINRLGIFKIGFPQVFCFSRSAIVITKTGFQQRERGKCALILTLRRLLLEP